MIMAVGKSSVQGGLAGWRPRRGNAVIPVWWQSAIELEWADNVDEDESCLMENSLLLRRGQYICSMLFYLVFNSLDKVHTYYEGNLLST